MTVAGVKIRVPRWMLQEAARHLLEGWKPLRRRARIPGTTDGGDALKIARAHSIATQMVTQIATRRAFKDRPILIVLSREDAVWLGDNLPRRAPLFAPPLFAALYTLGLVARIEGGHRRGRRVVWPDVMQRRIGQKNPMIDLSVKQIQRYDQALRPEDDSDWPDYLKHPI